MIRRCAGEFYIMLGSSLYGVCTFYGRGMKIEISGRRNRKQKKRNRDAEKNREGNLVNTEFTHVYFP